MRFRLLSPILLTALLLPTSAAGSGLDVINDCVAGDGLLSRTYTQSEYRSALNQLPADVEQYSPCRDAIRAAARGAGLSGSSGGGGTPASPGSWGGSPVPGVPVGVDPLATVTPEERAKIATAAETGGGTIALDGRPVDPSALGAATISSPLDLPTPLLLLLVCTAIGVLAIAARGLEPHVRKRRATR